MLSSEVTFLEHRHHDSHRGCTENQSHEDRVSSQATAPKRQANEQSEDYGNEKIETGEPTRSLQEWSRRRPNSARFGKHVEVDLEAREKHQEDETKLRQKIEHRRFMNEVETALANSNARDDFTNHNRQRHNTPDLTHQHRNQSCQSSEEQ